MASDAPAIEALIPLSVHGLQSSFYTQTQRDAALGPVFGVDRQLIRDGTYFVVTLEERMLGCGGWSYRQSLYGGDTGRPNEPCPVLDPTRDAARVRAFFVHPEWARRGIGRRILEACEQGIQAAGFRRVELVATLAGEPLYASLGYREAERYDIPLANGLGLPVVRMTRDLIAEGRSGSRRIKLLFVCSRNRRRSLTAERCFANSAQYDVRSAGTQPEARVALTAGLIGWADVVFFMERSHQNRAAERFSEALAGKPAVVLHIPDEHEFMATELVDEIETKVALAMESWGGESTEPRD